MKGRESNRHQLEFGFCAEDLVPERHPIRGIKVFVEKILVELRHELGDMYSERGRPSIPPETLLKSLLLMVLYSIRSERQFCEMLQYNLLYQWFLNRSVMDPIFDPSVFSKNRERLLNHDIARKFFETVNEHLKEAGLMESEHFSVDGTLIQAWASLKSLEERDKDDFDKRTKGKKPSSIGRNDKYESSTDPEASVASKPGVSPMLAYMGNILVENRHGLCVDVEILSATGTAECEGATDMLKRQIEAGMNISTVGADANYHRAEFVTDLRQLNIAPHIAPQGNRNLKGLDGRTFKSIGYTISQSARRRIEKNFGWLKSVGGWYQTKYRGTQRVSLFALFGASVFNILRSLKLKPSLAWG